MALTIERQPRNLADLPASSKFPMQVTVRQRDPVVRHHQLDVPLSFAQFEREDNSVNYRDCVVSPAGFEPATY